MTTSRNRITLALLFFFLFLAPSQAASDPEILARIDTPQTQTAISVPPTTPAPPIELKPLALPPLKDRLMKPPATRRGSFGNSHVDLAPKSWPYPMVVSPGRPVLPGTAW